MEDIYLEEFYEIENERIEMLLDMVRQAVNDDKSKVTVYEQDEVGSGKGMTELIVAFRLEDKKAGDE